MYGSTRPMTLFGLVKVLGYTCIILTGFGWFSLRTSFPNNPFSLRTIFITTRAGSRNLARSKEEFFLIIVNSARPLALNIRNSILDLVGLLDPPLFNIIIL